MSVLPVSKHFAVKPLSFKLPARKQCALLLGCMLAQQSALATADDAAIFFQAAPLPAAASSLDVQAGGGDDAEFASFAMFEPIADSAHVRALIAGLEAEGDYDSPKLAELSQDLGKALQAEGQHRAALAAYDRSFQIVRRQEGLVSTAQAAILRAKIGSAVALGDLAAGDLLQQSLFGMQQQLLAAQPLALADAHRAAADWNLKYYLQATQTPVLGGRTAEQDALLVERLATAYMQYHKALWLLATNDAQGSYAEKAALERKIAALNFMVDKQHQRSSPTVVGKLGQGAMHQRKRRHNPVLVEQGSAALQRAIEYGVASAEPALVAERQLELGDWYLLMDQPDEARATYTAAAAALRAAGVDEQGIAARLDSGLPVHDPESALLALARHERTGAFDGYVDVSFDLDRYGAASNARVLASSAQAADVEEELLRHIEQARFRPGFEQGALVARSNVRLRYYFAR